MRSTLCAWGLLKVNEVYPHANHARMHMGSRCQACCVVTEACTVFERHRNPPDGLKTGSLIPPLRIKIVKSPRLRASMATFL